MIKKISNIFMLLIAIMLIASGCGNKTSSRVADSNSDKQSSTANNNEAASKNASDSTQKPKETTASGSKILVAYFSLAGEQYDVGTVDKGNTAVIAEIIADETGADLFQIEPVTPYPTTYKELLNIAQKEINDDSRPEISSTVDKMDDYDVVYIGYPIWYGNMPKIVYNFLESYNFTGKTVIPFCTHGGSGLSGTESEIAKICDGATMKSGFAIEGKTAQDDQDKARSNVEEWLKEGGLIQ